MLTRRLTPITRGLFLPATTSTLSNERQADDASRLSFLRSPLRADQRHPAGTGGSPKHPAVRRSSNPPTPDTTQHTHLLLGLTTLNLPGMVTQLSPHLSFYIGDPIYKASSRPSHDLKNKPAYNPLPVLFIRHPTVRSRRRVLTNLSFHRPTWPRIILLHRRINSHRLWRGSRGYIHTLHIASLRRLTVVLDNNHLGGHRTGRPSTTTIPMTTFIEVGQHISNSFLHLPKRPRRCRQVLSGR